MLRVKKEEVPATAPSNADEAQYLAAVERCKAVSAAMSDKQWVLGDEAANVAKVYGENRLEQFAVDINFSGSVCTLGRYRSVCLAFPKTGGRPRFFASAQILQGHPDRIQIVTKNRDVSKHEAREIMRQWRAEHADTDEDPAELEEDEDTELTPETNTATPRKANGAKEEANGEQKPEWDRDTKGWFNNLVERVRDVIDELNKVMENCEREHRNLLTILEPSLLSDVSQKLKEKCAEFEDWVETPLEEAAETLIRKGRVRKTPTRPRTAQPVQPVA
jgi:hypothetical protein